MTRQSNRIAKMGDFDDLDAIDLHILELLQNNARTSNKELAQKVGLAPSSCLRRVRALEQRGALRNYRAEVHPGALGIGLEAMVSVRLDVHSRDAFEGFAAHLRTLPEVVGHYSLGGADDFLIHVAVRDSDHLRTLTLDSFAARDEVRHLETAVIFTRDGNRLPILRGRR